MARKLWTNRSSKHDYPGYCFVIDVDEVAAINVPNINEPGMVIILKSGNVINFPTADRQYRNDMIQFFVDFASDKIFASNKVVEKEDSDERK